jgi:hypothetical protein
VSGPLPSEIPQLEGVLPSVPVKVAVKLKFWPQPEAVPVSVKVSVPCARFPIPLSYRRVTGPQD